MKTHNGFGVKYKTPEEQEEERQKILNKQRHCDHEWQFAGLEENKCIKCGKRVRPGSRKGYKEGGV